VIEVGARTIHLVYESDTRNVVFVRLPPDRLRLRLNAGDGIEDRDRAVEHTKAALDLDGEVDVARSVDDIDRYSSPFRFQKQVVAAEVIVMPRSCSCSIQSMTAVPSWTSPIL
jgi:hypothetical protein